MTIAQRVAYRPVHNAVLQALSPAANRVLDVGCGTGELAQRIRDEHPGTAAIGCDFSAGMLARARAKTQAARWVQGDACRLPFRDGAFDVVISTEAFHWFPDQDAALREACRVLAPGGRLLLALIAPPPPVVNRMIRVGSRLVGEPFYWPTRSELSAMLERAGFRVEDWHRLFRLPGILLPALTTAVRREPRRGDVRGCARARRRRRLTSARPTKRRAGGGGR
jgi:ubiquinone/menaquinone biosynthesis C-methylase UbiE